MNLELRAYHGDQNIKDFYLARVRAHKVADEIIKGTYWQNGKGCAIGCTIHSSAHSAYETELGIPRQLARIEDGIFEGLPNGKAKEWPERFLEAITPGVNLYPAYWQFMVWLLVDSEQGVIRFAKKESSKKAIEYVATLYRRMIQGETVSREDWRDAAAAAAAYADAYAYAAAYAARQEARVQQSEALLRFLAEAK